MQPIKVKNIRLNQKLLHKLKTRNNIQMRRNTFHLPRDRKYRELLILAAKR